MLERQIRIADTQIDRRVYDLYGLTEEEIEIGMTLFMISIFFSFSAYKIKSYRRDPEPGPLRDEYLTTDDKTVKEQLIANFIESIEENKTKIAEKVKYINYSLIFLFVGLIVLISSIIVG